MNIEKFNTTNKALEKAMPLITPTGVLIALLFGKYFIPLKPLVNILFGFMTFFGAMKINARDILDAFKKPIFILVYALASFLAMPLIAKLIATTMFNSNLIVGSGYNMIRAVPTAIVGSVWATMFHGNLTVSLAILLLDTMLAPIVTPFMLNLSTGTILQFDTISMMKSLFFMVVLPFLIGLIFNHFYSNEIKEYIGPITNPISKMLFFVEIIINVSQVSERLISGASLAYIISIIAAILLSISGFAIGHILCKIFKVSIKEDISVTFAVALRNTNAALVLAIGFLPEAASLPIILSIVIQQTLAAIMGKILFQNHQTVKSIT